MIVSRRRSGARSNKQVMRGRRNTPAHSELEQKHESEGLLKTLAFVPLLALRLRFAGRKVEDAVQRLLHGSGLRVQGCKRGGMQVHGGVAAQTGFGEAQHLLSPVCKEVEDLPDHLKGSLPRRFVQLDAGE